MTVKVDARCCICGSKEFGSESTNENYRTYEVKEEDLDHKGSAYGTETLVCPTCSDHCDRTECEELDPCENCAVETVHNRCRSSTPSLR